MASRKPCYHTRGRYQGRLVISHGIELAKDKKNSNNAEVILSYGYPFRVRKMLTGEISATQNFKV